MPQPINEFGTFLSYADNNSYTSERGASKLAHSLFQTSTMGLGDSGAVINGFYVTEDSTPSMYVKIVPSEVTDSSQDGHCLIDRNDYCYIGWLAQEYRLRLNNSTTSPRLSLIVAYVDRSISWEEEDNVVESPSVLKFAEVTSGNAQLPTSNDIKNQIGQDNPYIILAGVAVTASASRIIQADITDTRKFAKIADNVMNSSLSNYYSEGFVQANGTRTKIIVTDASSPTVPSAIPGVQILWLRKQG